MRARLEKQYIVTACLNMGWQNIMSELEDDEYPQKGHIKSKHRNNLRTRFNKLLHKIPGRKQMAKTPGKADDKGAPPLLALI